MEPINLQKRRKKQDKLTRTELFKQIVMVMNRERFAPADWPEFPHIFHFVADRSGRKAILEEFDDQIVAYRDRDVVSDAILQYCWEHIPYVPGATGVDAELAGKCRNMWLGLTAGLTATPFALLEKSQPGLTFKRLPFDAPPSLAASPQNFETLLARFSDPLTVCAFIGSLFYPEADRQQYLYLQGDGGDGKGSLMKFLQKIFGDAAQALNPPAKDGDKFWNFNLYGKRLGMFFDCDTWTWFRSAHFKSVTGGDPLHFEEKGRMGFTAIPNCKFIVSSNYSPNVSSQAADMRRLLYVSCLPVPDDLRTPNFEDVLMSEAEAIISNCKAVYLDRCPGHRPIPADKPIEVALAAESTYIDLFHQHFAVGAECALSGAEVNRVLTESGIRSNKEIAMVKGVWQRIFGVKIEHKKGGTRYLGMGFRSRFSENTGS